MKSAVESNTVSWNYGVRVYRGPQEPSGCYLSSWRNGGIPSVAMHCITSTSELWDVYHCYLHWMGCTQANDEFLNTWENHYRCWRKQAHWVLGQTVSSELHIECFPPFSMISGGWRLEKQLLTSLQRTFHVATDEGGGRLLGIMCRIPCSKYKDMVSCYVHETVMW